MYSDRGGVLGKYQVVAEIARGGMGVVYLAMTKGPGGFSKLVVVKELHPELVEDPAFPAMFLDEAKLAARLNHPNIVQTNEVGNDGDRYFMVMDYLDGRGLDQIRRRAKAAGGGPSLAMLLRVLIDMLGGLDYAHKLTDFGGAPMQIVHRDVSPQNVFVTFDGQVKLLDFGIAKAASSSHETQAGVLKGKVAYMSPEQARGQKVDARADVFSAGVMLWETLARRRLRGGKNDQQMLWALVAADLPRASTVNPDVPPELDEICARAMAWNRDDRYQSAGALQVDLERYVARSGTTASAREIGACVSELFRDDRARTNALIDAYVARASHGDLSGDLPVIDVASRAAASGTPSSQKAASLPAPAPADPTRVDSASGSAAAPSTPRLTPRSARTPWVIAGIATGLALAGAVIMALRSTATPEPEPPRRVGAVTPSAPVMPEPRPATPDLVTVEIRVTPPEAYLSIDDAIAGSNPFSGRFPIGPAPHRVRARAPGYASKLVLITFDANVTLELNLDKLEPARPAPARVEPARVTRTRPPARTAPPPPPPRPEPAPAVEPPHPVTVEHPPEPKPAVKPNELEPAAGTRPKRTIDPADPYEGER
jgi:serine/threonine protein kinase